MFSLALWLSGPMLEVLLLGRAIRGKFLNRYAFFYLYVGWVLLHDSSLILIYEFWPKAYALAYWTTETLSVLAGCGLVWEVYKVALARYPGASRMARNVLLFLFVFAITRVLVRASGNPAWTVGRSTLETELDLRIVQTALLVGLVVLFGYYAIPLGRNLKGVVYGYGFFLVTSVANLTLRDYIGPSFQRLWQTIQPVCYLIVLFVWCAALWSYAPVPEPELEPQLETDYQVLATQTKAKLSAARARLLRDMRP